MMSGFDPGALMARYYLLADGLRVCLRLARPRDEAGVARLFWLGGREPDELALVRLLRFDHGRVSICATALVDGVETVLGIGAIELTPGAPVAPELVLVDQSAGPGLEELLSDALLGRAQALRRSRVA
jgi:hypothetical protein